MSDEIEKIDRINMRYEDFKSLIFEAVAATRLEPRESAINNNYAETEAKLYNYPIWILKVEKDLRDIEDYEKEVVTGKSKDIIKFGGGSGVRIDPEERQRMLISSKVADMEKTLKEIKKIDEALKVVKNFEGYRIIELRYFKRLKHIEIIKKLKLDSRLYYSLKNRLVSDVEAYLFG